MVPGLVIVGDVIIGNEATRINGIFKSSFKFILFGESHVFLVKQSLPAAVRLFVCVILMSSGFDQNELTSDNLLIMK